MLNKNFTSVIGLYRLAIKSIEENPELERYSVVPKRILVKVDKKTDIGNAKYSFMATSDTRNQTTTITITLTEQAHMSKVSSSFIRDCLVVILNGAATMPEEYDALNNGFAAMAKAANIPLSWEVHTCDECGKEFAHGISELATHVNETGHRCELMRSFPLWMNQLS